MIPERYMVTAVPIDGGERLCGYVLKAAGMMFISVFGKSEPIAIDPDTIKPAKVKPKFIPDATAPESIICPNCEHDLMGGIELDASDDPAYCWKCGMALEWEAQ